MGVFHNLYLAVFPLSYLVLFPLLYDAELLCGGLGLDAGQKTRVWLIGLLHHDYLPLFSFLCDATLFCEGLVLHAAVIVLMLHVSDNTSP